MQTTIYEVRTHARRNPVIATFSSQSQAKGYLTSLRRAGFLTDKETASLHIHRTTR